MLFFVSLFVFPDTELILIIVGTVLGAAVLCLAIAVTVVSIR